LDYRVALVRPDQLERQVAKASRELQELLVRLGHRAPLDFKVSKGLLAPSVFKALLGLLALQALKEFRG
jgi:hypothetical protein